MINLAAPTSVYSTLALLLQGGYIPGCSLINCQTTQARLASAKAAKLPKPRVYLIHIAATPATAMSERPIGDPEPLFLLYWSLVWYGRSSLASQKQRHKENPG
jgi:hypothetical protein